MLLFLYNVSIFSTLSINRKHLNRSGSNEYLQNTKNLEFFKGTGLFERQINQNGNYYIENISHNQKILSNITGAEIYYKNNNQSKVKKSILIRSVVFEFKNLQHFLKNFSNFPYIHKNFSETYTDEIFNVDFESESKIFKIRFVKIAENSKFILKTKTQFNNTQTYQYNGINYDQKQNNSVARRNIFYKNFFYYITDVKPIDHRSSRFLCKYYFCSKKDIIKE
ncbi:hypothetical protein GVAV_002997 [Gurleya vavrai]